jgi:hypothetical protein
MDVDCDKMAALLPLTTRVMRPRDAGQQASVPALVRFLELLAADCCNLWAEPIVAPSDQPT